MAHRRWIVAIAVALGCGGGGGGGTPQGDTSGHAGTTDTVDSLQWWAQVGGAGDQVIHPFAAGFDAAGNVLLLVTTPAAGPGARALELHRFDGAGTPLGTVSWPYGSSALDPPLDFRMAAAPDGDAIIAIEPSSVCGGTACGTPIDLGAGPVTVPTIARVGPGGELRWQRTLAAAAEGLHVDGSGGVLAVAGAPAMNFTPWDRPWGMGTIVQRLDADGSEVWTRSYDVARCAADEEGNAVCSVVPAGATPEWGTPTMRIEKVAALDGAVVWWRELGSDRSYPVAARGGRIVVAIYSTLLVLDADGIGQSEVPMGTIEPTFIAIGASGRVYVGETTVGSCGSTSGIGNGVAVSAFGPDGTYLWTHALEAQMPSGCDWSALPTIDLGGMAVGPGDDVAVSLDFSGTLVAGGTTITSEGLDALVAVLRD